MGPSWAAPTVIMRAMRCLLDLGWAPGLSPARPRRMSALPDLPRAISADITSPNLEQIAQAITHEVDREHGESQERAREQDDPEGALHVGPPLRHDIAPRGDDGGRARAEKGQVRLEENGRRADVGALDDEWGHERRQDVAQEDPGRLRPDGPCPLDHGLLAEAQHRSAHEA